jgi:hypothetical protein
MPCMAQGTRSRLASVELRRALRIIAGTILWTAVAFATGQLLTDEKGVDQDTSTLLRSYFKRRPSRVRVDLPRAVLVEVGDEVHLAGSAGKPAGEVDALLDEDGSPIPALYDWTSAVRVRFFDGKAVDLRADASARLIRVPQTGAWVLQTLLTEKTIPRIAAAWNETMLVHREEIFALLTPIARDLLLDLERHVEKEFGPFLERHREEVRELGTALENEAKGPKLAEVFERDIWPIAQPKVRPIIESVSNEVWENLPIWGFTWRLAYQALPFTDNDHVEKAWVDFLEGQVAPILRAHSEDIAKAGREIAREALARGSVTESFRAAFSGIVAHPKFHALSQVFLKEVFLDNPAFHEVLRVRLRSPEVRHAVEAASAHLEPMVRQMGDIILGTRKEGITSEFARVLRAQILYKDLQRIVIDPGSAGAPPLAAPPRLTATVEWDIKKE